MGKIYHIKKKSEEKRMRFTKYNSMNDILAYPNMEEYLKVFILNICYLCFQRNITENLLCWRSSLEKHLGRSRFLTL